MTGTNRFWIPEATPYGTLAPFQPRNLMEYWDRPDPEGWAKILAGFRLFSGVPRRRLRRLVGQSKLIEYGLGEAVVVQGTPGDALYVVLSGSAKARGLPAGRMLGVGDYFGELSLLGDAPRSATVIATSELQVMRIPRAAFLRFARRHPAISEKMVAALGSQIRRLEARIAHA